MATRTDGIVRFLDFPLFINDVTDPFCIASLGVIAGAVGESNRACGIAEKEKRKLILLRKGSILGDRVKTHAKDFDIPSTEFLDLVTEPATFRRSTWGVGFRIKP